MLSRISISEDVKPDKDCCLHKTGHPGRLSLTRRGSLQIQSKVSTFDRAAHSSHSDVRHPEKHHSRPTQVYAAQTSVCDTHDESSVQPTKEVIDELAVLVHK